jgi:hypothetical protein
MAAISVVEVIILIGSARGEVQVRQVAMKAMTTGHNSLEQPMDLSIFMYSLLHTLKTMSAMGADVDDCLDKDLPEILPVSIRQSPIAIAGLESEP